ncbi:MAG: hypothetical protein RL096_411 [Actinomycetota bacterium]
MYLQKIDRLRDDDELKPEIYDQTIDYIRKSYLNGVIQSLCYNNKFYKKIESFESLHKDKSLQEAF